MASSLFSDDLLEVLSLEKLDRDLYRGINVETWGPALYGGQVAGQALAAAASTVDPDRRPHSLHGYFLRRGNKELPVTFKVDRDRDGGSFSARHVAAEQDGEVIFSMLASFQMQKDEQWAELDNLEPRWQPPTLDEEPRQIPLLIEVIEREPPQPDEAVDDPDDYLYLRSASKLGDDPVIHAAALVYLSDLHSGYRRTFLPELANGGPSIDHFVYFYEPVRADEWLGFQMWPTAAKSRRGLYEGQLRTEQGKLAAAIGQECLLIERSAMAPATPPGFAKE
jgi:acyl-CoA thioesterase II